MIDLTKITTPYGLLDKETQKALKEHRGPYEVYYGVDEASWNLTQPAWAADTVYRVRPEPPKPREIWVTEYPSGTLYAYRFKKTADESRGYGGVTTRFVEVIE